MKTLLASFSLMTTLAFGASSVHEFTLNALDGKPLPLANFKGKVVLMVNVASQCGYTYQYETLQALYQKYKDQGLVLAGFPANNFGGQEPGSDAEIKQFCTAKFDVSFPIFSKISVKGDDKAPLYKLLTSKDTNGDFGGDIAWNFTKFLVDKNGKVYARFASKTTPDDPKVVEAIEKGLK